MPTNLTLRITDEAGELRYFTPLQEAVHPDLIAEIQNAIALISEAMLGMAPASEEVLRIELVGSLSPADQARRRPNEDVYDEIDCLVADECAEDPGYDPPCEEDPGINHAEPATSSLIDQLGASAS